MRRIPPLLIIIAVVLLGGALWLWLRGSGGEAATAGAGAPGPGGPGGGEMQLPVEAATVRSEPLQSSLSTVGTTRADESVILRPEVAGRIVKLPFAEGERVKQGDVLFALDDSVPRAAVAEAEATLVNARLADKRASDLGERRLIPQSDIDTLRSQLGVAQARIASARATLGKYTIRAPFDGVIGLREVSAGEYVSPGQALVSLVRLDPMEVDFSLPENQLANVKPGQPLRLTVDAYPGETFTGTLAAIDPVIDINSRSAKLRARIDNSDYRLRPGLFARVELGTGEANQTGLMIPEQSLLQQGEERFVYRVVDGKAVRTVVQTGLRLPGKIQVISGLSEGDQVISAGQAKPMMFDGAGVMVMPTGDEADPQAPATSDAAPAATTPPAAAPNAPAANPVVLPPPDDGGAATTPAPEQDAAAPSTR